MYRARVRLRVFCLLVALVYAAPGALLAAGEGQSDITRARFDLGLWSLIVFGLLFLVLRKWAWGPMLQGLKKREEGILGAIAEAQRTRDDARLARDELQKRLDKAHEEVREIIDEARRDAKALQDEMMQQARTEIQAERGRLRREIDIAKDQALQELWNRSAELASLVSSKAIRRHISPDDHRRLLNEALDELRAAGDERHSQLTGISS